MAAAAEAAAAKRDAALWLQLSRGVRSSSSLLLFAASMPLYQQITHRDKQSSSKHRIVLSFLYINIYIYIYLFIYIQGDG